MKGRRRNNQSAKARSPGVDANSIPMIYDRTMQAVDYIENLSEHDPEVTKVITSCSTLFIYAKDSQTSDPYLMLDEITIDHANHLYEIDQMLDSGSSVTAQQRCPHESECGDSDCGTCIFAQLKHIDIGRIRGSFQTTPTSGGTEDR